MTIACGGMLLQLLSGYCIRADVCIVRIRMSSSSAELYYKIDQGLHIQISLLPWQITC